MQENILFNFENRRTGEGYEILERMLVSVFVIADIQVMSPGM